MSSLDFPTKLADLTLNDATHNPSLYANLGSLRKSALSIPHRLNSVLADARFAKEISRSYGLPLVANERCGSWYIDPVDKVGSAYFKSTDGHHGQWDFSLRRLNLQLFPVLDHYGGAVVVDSTRRGKNMPDSFSKTVPIWVAVLNRTLFPELPLTHCLQHPPPPNDLGPSEVSQIEARLDGFAQSFRSLRLDMPKLREELKRPIRLTWSVNGCVDREGLDVFDSEKTDPLQDCHTLVLCSASRRVRGAEASEGGYIQGAGDDSEAWAHGLTSKAFWRYRQELMESPEAELPVLIEKLLGRENANHGAQGVMAKIIPTSNLYIGVGPAGTIDSFDLVINCQGDGASTTATSKVRNLKCRTGKLGSKDLRDKLPAICDTVQQRLLNKRQSQILVTCTTGTDLSAGVVAALLCLFFDDEGGLVCPGGILS